MKKNLMKILSLILALSMIACFTACGEEEAPAAETEETVDIADPEAALREQALSIVKEIYSGNPSVINDHYLPALGSLEQTFLDMLQERIIEQGEIPVDSIDITFVMDVDAELMARFSAEYSLEPTAAKQITFGAPRPTAVEGEYKVTEICTMFFVQLDDQWYITDWSFR